VERWAADVAESHATYLPLVRFRSPRPKSSWVLALLAVMDSAALYLALSPHAAPTVEARLCLRAGSECLTRMARAMGCDVPEMPDRAATISLTYAEFLEALDRVREVGFDIERDPADAWPDFVGWRVNYEQAATPSPTPSTRHPPRGQARNATRRSQSRRTARPPSRDKAAIANREAAFSPCSRLRAHDVNMRVASLVLRYAGPPSGSPSWLVGADMLSPRAVGGRRGGGSFALGTEALLRPRRHAAGL
jgi:hypothetical protein